ncbi:hypothetical protein AVV36_gp059 [Pectobacterium bacteriophage PM2]|uniref:Uncharacterized protein n=1 Tax=Pectobacterium bacteriophage PM2 TaxID=1429794 RepID=A0A0A0Q0B7_9CAUD|nr:hypothetical protein AVV36_gp059 [Pectobacterium bacteriophage PM2]AHY25021.1 hypothetical protein PM2_059 [Pectobacterium bacteriophage PM2]
MDFQTGQHLLAIPEIKKYVLVNTLENINHLVTEKMLRDAFLNECDKIMSNRVPSWFVYEYFD